MSCLAEDVKVARHENFEPLSRVWEAQLPSCDPPALRAALLKKQQRELRLAQLEGWVPPMAQLLTLPPFQRAAAEDGVPVRMAEVCAAADDGTGQQVEEEAAAMDAEGEPEPAADPALLAQAAQRAAQREQRRQEREQRRQQLLREKREAKAAARAEVRQRQGEQRARWEAAVAEKRQQVEELQQGAATLGAQIRELEARMQEVEGQKHQQFLQLKQALAEEQEEKQRQQRLAALEEGEVYGSPPGPPPGTTAAAAAGAGGYRDGAPAPSPAAFGGPYGQQVYAQQPSASPYGEAVAGAGYVPGWTAAARGGSGLPSPREAMGGGSSMDAPAAAREFGGGGRGSFDERRGPYGGRFYDAPRRGGPPPALPAPGPFSGAAGGREREHQGSLPRLVPGGGPRLSYEDRERLRQQRPQDALPPPAAAPGGASFMGERSLDAWEYGGGAHGAGSRDAFSAPRFGSGGSREGTRDGFSAGFGRRPPDQR